MTSATPGSHDAPDTVVSESIEVAAPPSTVFAILADPRQHPRIDGSGSLTGTLKGPDRLTAKGDTFGMDMKMFGLPYKIRNTVVEYDADRRIAWRHFAGHRWRYVLEPVDVAGEPGTRVTEQFDVSRAPAPARLFVRLTGFAERNRRGIEQTLVNLKQAAEADDAKEQ